MSGRGGERGSSRRAIRASEIGEYVFCHRAWWLRHVAGHESANTRQMELGTAAHAQHGRLVGLGAALRGLAMVLLVLAIVAAVAAMMGR